MLPPLLVPYHLHLQLYRCPRQGGELGEEVSSKPSTSSFAPQNTELGGEKPADVFAIPTPSHNHSHIGGHPIASLQRDSHRCLCCVDSLHDGSICGLNNPAGGGVVPSAAFTVRIPSHSFAFTLPTPPRSSRRTPPPLRFKCHYRLDRYHPIHYFPLKIYSLELSCKS